jgi:hypothetical protein
MARKNGTRRQFLKGSAVVLGATALPAGDLAVAQTAPVEPRAIVAALGDTLIPTDGAGYPGYKHLEPSGISTRVLNTLRFVDRVSLPELALFNTSAQSLLGKTFVDLDESGREAWLNAILAANSKPVAGLDKPTVATLQKVLRLARDRVMNVFYRNFPYDHVDREASGAPIPNQPHEIFQIKTGNLVTGWDIAGYRGPLTWEEEEERRNHFKQIRWEEPAP